MLGKNLKEIRAEKKLSLRALAEISDVSKSTLSDIENENVKSTTITTLEKIADALEVSTGYLIGESIDYILKNRLNEMGITYEDLSIKTGLSVVYLEGLEKRHPDEGDYRKMKILANALKMNPEHLISALAKQEPPLMEDRIKSTPEEDFGRFIDMENSSLTEFDVFTLAANFVDYEEPLTELDIEKMKLALKVALSNES